MSEQTARMDANTIEGIIDRIGLVATFDMIATICHEKSDHIASNWQDMGLANEWTNAAKLIGRFSRKLAV